MPCLDEKTLGNIYIRVFDVFMMEFNENFDSEWIFKEELVR
jgi:hypothetical protein